MTPEQFRSRSALARFKNALDALEQEFKPLAMDPDLRLLLGRMSATCRTFFDRANREVFSQVNGKDRYEPTNPVQR